MLEVDLNFLWAAINLLVLYLFLRKVLFGKVGAYMQQRTQAIADSIEKGEKMQAGADEMLAELESNRERSVEECSRMISEARQKAAGEYEEIIVNARKEAAYILANANEQAERNRLKAMESMKDEITEIALSAATKVVTENMDNERNRRIVQRFLEEQGVA